MTREEFNAAVGADRKKRLSNVISYNQPKQNVQSQKVGAEELYSAPTTTFEPKAISNNNVDKIDTWLEPSYKLNKDEQEEAKAYIKQWRNENAGFGKNPLATEESRRELDRINNLDAKISNSAAIFGGFSDSIPFLKSIQNKFAPEDENIKALQSSQLQNPIASTAGNVAGELGKYYLGGQLLTEAGLLGEGGKFTKGVSKYIKNPNLAGSVANIVGDTSLDIALDTIPHLVEDISNGDEKAGVNALKNAGTNLAFNTLGEGVGIVGGKVIGKLADKKQLGKATSLNPLEEHVNAAEEIVKDTDDLQKQVLESSQNLTNNLSMKSGDDSSVENAVQISNRKMLQKAKEDNYIPGTYRNSQGIESYSAHEINNFSSDKGRVSGKDSFADFIDESISDVKSSKKYYFGKISEELNNDIVANTGESFENFNIVLKSDEIRHANNGHDDLTREDFELIPAIFNKPDLIEKSSKLDGNGRQALKFRKQIDGTIATVTGISKGRHNLEIDTLYFTKTKNPNHVVDNAKVPNQTPEVNMTQGFSNNIISNLEKNVNAITDYKKVKIPNHDEMNKNIDKYVGMYGDEAAKSKALEFKQSVNRVIAENSDEAWEELIKNTNELDAMLQGKTYTFKNQKSGKNKSNVRQATYNNEIRDIFTYETNSISKEAAENALNNGKVSKARSNTLENSDINTSDELKNQYLNEDNFKYQEISEKQSMEEATTRVGLNQEHWKNKLMAQDSLSGTDVDTMMMIYTDAVQKARQSGDDELWKEAGAIFKKIQEAGTKGGQLVQSFAKWSRNTPEGIVAESFRKAKEQTASVIGDKKAQKLIDDLYEDVQKEIYTLANAAYSSGVNSRAAQIAFAKIGKIINANTPKTVSGAVKTYLMDSMLLNFRTLISRNAGGNLGYNAMEFVRQPITAGIDRTLSTFTGKRTRTGWSKDKIKSAGEGFLKGILDEANDIRKGVHTAKSGDNTIQNAINLNSHSLNGTNPVSHAINKIDDITKHMLSVGDRPFYESAYKQRMAELTDLRKKGLLGADISKLSDNEFKEFAELSAKMDGLTATYQDDGAMAKALGNLKKAVGSYSEGAVGFDALSQFAMPFTQTPGNIITRSIEYSPFGVIKNAVNTGREAKLGKFDQQRFADELGRNILGTGLFAGGIAAYNKGAMTGGYSDDKDEKESQKREGMQQYALRTNIGGQEGNFDISWIPVLGNNMVMAAATKEAFDKGENPYEAIGKSASASANALLNTSTLQGMNRIFGGDSSFSNESNFFENAKDTLTSGFGQSIPSLVRQISQSTDQYERDLSEGDRKYWQNSLINGIPFLREKMLQPKVDNEGNFVEQNQGRSTLSKIVENMVSPGKYTVINESDISKEAKRISKSTNNNYSYIPTPSRNDITTDDFTPNDKEYREYKQKLGSYNSKLAGALIDSSYYQSLTDEGKENALSKVYKAMKAVAKMETLPNYSSDDKIADAFIKGGAQAAIDYMQYSNSVKYAGLKQNTDKNKNIYDKFGDEGLKLYSEAREQLEDDENLTVKKLMPLLDTKSLSSSKKGEYMANFVSLSDGAQKLADSEDYESVYQYYNIKYSADKPGKGYGSLSQKELKEYFANSNLSQEEKRKWFSIYFPKSNNPY